MEPMGKVLAITPEKCTGAGSVSRSVRSFMTAYPILLEAGSK